MPICGVHGGGKSEFSVLHKAYGFIIILHFHDANHRTKRLIAHHTHRMIHIHQDRRLKEIALTCNTFSASENGSTSGPRLLHLPFKKRELLFPGEGSDIHVISGGTANFPGLHFADKSLHIIVVYLLMHINSFYRAATLAVVIKSAIRRGRCHTTNVFYIVTNKQRILSSQLTLAGNHPGGYSFVYVSARFVRPCEEISIEWHI